MKLNRKAYQHMILSTCVTTAVGVILGMISLGTEEWVSASAKFTVGSYPDSYINYGLFSGTYNRYVARRDYYLITMTCNAEGQACAMLCTEFSEDRDKQLETLVNNQRVEFDMACPRIQRNIPLADVAGPNFGSSRATDDYTFINYGIYVSTIAFLALGIVLGIVATGLSVWNTIGNPIYSIFNVFGIIGLNAAAAVCVIISMIMWGVQYNITLIDNIAVLETIIKDMETMRPSLGYSYWINIGSIILYCTTVGVLLVRSVLLQKEPEATNLEMIKSDDRTIVLF